MPDASYVQTSFLGGEWSPMAQGRMEHPKYPTALSTCLNAIPVEEGGIVRRPGFQFAATTHNGLIGRVMPFNFTDAAPYTLEFTNNAMRFFTGTNLVYTNDVTPVFSVSTDTPAIVEMGGPTPWATGDQIEFIFNTLARASEAAILQNRQFAITVIDSTHFSISDPITGAAVNGAQVNWVVEDISAQAGRILQIATPYITAQLPSIRKIQAAGVGPDQSDVCMLLDGVQHPQTLTGIANATAPQLASFAITQQDFSDGPYLAPVSGSYVTPNATSGPITLSIGYQAYGGTTAYPLGAFVLSSGVVYECISVPNIGNTPASSPTFWQVVNAGSAVGPLGFQAGDVGRAIRLLSEPAAWASGTAYTTGQAVKFNGSYYVATANSTGQEPDTALTDWIVSVSSSVYTWTWGKITSVTNGNTVVVNLYGPNLLYNAIINTWQVGVYSDAVGWPTCGCYYEGRLWLAGAVPNRVDGGVSDDFFNFAPTGPDGTVGDANAIAAPFNSDDQNIIYWMEPTSQGIICGTKNGEWLISASNTQDPLTPSTAEAHRVTKVGCYNQIPIHTPLTMVLIHKYTKMLFEYFPDVFSGKLTSPNLNSFSKHSGITGLGIVELAYQAENTPIVWGRAQQFSGSSLSGWTYRRTSAFANEEPSFVGAHRHTLGSGRVLESMSIGPDTTQTYDALTLVTNDPTSGVNHVEVMTQIPNSDQPIVAGFYADDAVVPTGLEDTDGTGVHLYGLWHLNGKTASVTVAGIDCGDFTIANGTTFVPYKSDVNGLFTPSYILAASQFESAFFGQLATKYEQTILLDPGKATTPYVFTEWQFPSTQVQDIATFYINDWSGGISYGTCVSGGGRTGMRAFRINQATERDDKTYANIFAGSGDLGTPLVTTAPALSPSGLIIINNATQFVGPNPWAVFQAVRATDWSLRSTATVAGIHTAADMVIAHANGWDVAIIANFNSAFSTKIDAMIVNEGPFLWEVLGTTYAVPNQDNVILCPGFKTSDDGKDSRVFALGQPNSAFDDLSFTNLHEIFINGNGIAPQISGQIVGTLHASQVDANYPFFASQSFTGPGYDQTDGCLIFGCAVTKTAGSGTIAARYICKISDIGELLWKIPVPVLPTTTSLRGSQIAGGRYVFIPNSGQPSTTYIINTLTGAYTTFTTANLTGVTEQYYDAVSGQIIAFVNDVVSTPGVLQVGPGTPASFGPAVDGTAARWGRLTIGTYQPGTPGSALLAGQTQITSNPISAVVGFTYTTQGQVLRPVRPADVGAQNGPGFGKTKRQHMLAVLFAGALYATVSFGTLFNKLRPANFVQANNKPVPADQLYNDEYWHTLEDNYSFNSQLCWQVTRPVPANITALGGFVNTQDR